MGFFQNKLNSIFLGAAVVCAAAMFVLYPMQENADTIGAQIGHAKGEAVGLAVGSYKGVTEGIAAGNAAGTEQGLSAEDTAAVVGNTLAETAKLEVLVAGVKLTNMHSLGKDYQALYVVKGDAVFSVDLTKAKVSQSADGTLNVLIPEPEVELFVDEEGTEKLAEYQKYPFSGDAESGYTAYLNTMKNTAGEVRDSLENYDVLMKEAKDSAIDQITYITECACGKGRSVHVEFLDGGEEDAE